MNLALVWIKRKTKYFLMKNCSSKKRFASINKEKIYLQIYLYTTKQL